MTNFNEEIRELKRISEKIERYQDTREEYKIVPLADLLLTISNSIKDKYNEKYPGRLKNVNRDIHMEKFEDYSKGNLVRLEDVGLENDLPSQSDWPIDDFDCEDIDETQSESYFANEFETSKFSIEEDDCDEDVDTIIEEAVLDDKEIHIVSEQNKIEEKDSYDSIEEHKNEEHKELEKYKDLYQDISPKIDQDLYKDDLKQEENLKQKNEDTKQDRALDIESNSTEDVQANSELELDCVNTLTFLYKPILKENYLEGDYLRKFGIKRNSDLDSSKALDMHNKFWSANSVEYGNIFGSVPIDLIDEESANVLLKKGWRIAEVDIYEVQNDLEISEVNRYCKGRFDDFLVVKEIGGDAILVFYYKI